MQSFYNTIITMINDKSDGLQV